jgi:phosphoglycolate phosphatase
MAHLLNTADDLALSANLMLRDLEMPEQSTETIRSYIGKGIQKLVKRTLTGDLDGEPDAALFAKALPIYEKHYAENLSLNTRPYPGVVWKAYQSSAASRLPAGLHHQ